MALSTSFTGGWFFSGQFFDLAVAGHYDYIRDCQRTKHELQRSRGKFHLPATPVEVIALVAEQLIDEEHDQAIVNELYRQLEARFIDWEDEYSAQVLKERDRLVAKRAAMQKAEQKAKSEWMARRQKSQRVH